MSKKLPTKITPCPIIEVVSEVIFNRNLAIEPSAVYGKVYDQLKEKYGHAENMPIYQIPETLRLEDENLKNKPWHKFSNSEYAVMIGANVISIIAFEPYSGWTKYKKEIEFVLELFSKTGIAESVTRIGLKYVDKFDYPIIKKINFDITSSLVFSEKQEMQIRTTLPIKDGMNTIVNVVNAVDLQYKEKKENASILDIDVFQQYENAGECRMEDVPSFLDKAHEYQKELFFELVPLAFLEENNFTVE